MGLTAAQRLAAKFGAGTGAFHPLLCHMLDVAAVAEGIWDRRLAQSQRDSLATSLGLTQDEARTWVALLAGLHDFGKASIPFQAKDRAVADRLRGTGITAAFGQLRDGPGHGLVTAIQLPPLLESKGVARRLALRLGLVIGGHHGIFPAALEYEGSGAAIGEEDRTTRAAWDAARRDLFETMVDVLDVKGVPNGRLPNAAAMTIAGITSVADWIGSSERIGDWDAFTWDSGGAIDPAAYLVKARALAAQALRAIHFELPEEPTAPKTFEVLFDWQPRPLQVAVDRLATTENPPRLVILEAPMGEGKTEAALWLVYCWNADGTLGAYIALPTQATANQMHGRVKRFIHRRWSESADAIALQLVHGGSSLLDLDILPTGIEGVDGAREGSVAAGEWFLQRKRALIAPFGVGTIDQSLLAVLNVRHVFVRLFGLAGKPVVIDEVHAYDTYMTGLLERLLEWLGALGSPVVLLSATLPTTRRRTLMEAYRRGVLGAKIPLPEPEEPADYPRLTWLDRAGNIETASFPADERSRRRMALGFIKDSDEAVRELLQRELQDGGCAAVICNTVKRAQELYVELRDHFPADEVGLFHARFLAKDRETLETKFLGMFGPGSDPAHPRPTRFVLVATQVVEQSLDLDFDVMVSDLAPMDLLLQRSGRLQRHERDGRRSAPTLYIRCPEVEDDVPSIEHTSTYVYDEHILLRTWRLLRYRAWIDIPEELQALIDTVYSDAEDLPSDASARLAMKWRETWATMRDKQAAEQDEARIRRLRAPWSTTELGRFVQDARKEDDPDLHPALQALTRLAGPSVSIVILPAGSPLLPEGHTAPSRATTRELLKHSVSVSSPQAVRALLALAPPPAFEASAALQRHRLLVLDDHGTAQVGDLLFRYDSALGLVVIRTEGGR